MARSDDIESLIDPLARALSDCVREFDNIEQERYEDQARLNSKYKARLDEAQKALDEAVNKLAAARMGAEVEDVAKIAGRRLKPKKKWKEVAEALLRDPDAGYHELTRAIYGKINPAKIAALRSTMFHMRKAGAVDGEPGAWKLLRPPAEIEWLKVREDFGGDDAAKWPPHSPSGQINLMDVPRHHYEHLATQIREHAALYYDRNPIVADAEYDKLKRELLSIEKDNPNWIVPWSPSRFAKGVPPLPMEAYKKTPGARQGLNQESMPLRGRAAMKARR